MANTYYDSQLTAEEIEQVLEAISGILTSANNGKVLAISDGTIEARSVQWGGGEAVLEPLSVTENGDYTPEAGVDGFDEVHVAVPTVQPTLQSKTITPGASQQTVQPDSGYDGLSSVVVNGDADLVAGNIKKDVEIFGVTGSYEGGGGSAVVQPLSVIQNGTYNPPSGVDGYAPVSVNVSGGSGEAFVESQATAYFNTGVAGNSIYKIVLEFMPVTIVRAYQWYAGATENKFTIASMSASDGVTKGFIRCGNTDFGIVTFNIGVKNTIVCDQGKVYLNGSELSGSFSGAINTDSNTLKLLGSNANTLSHARIFKCELYNQSGDLIHNYIPFLDQNFIACLKDTVTNEIIYGSNNKLTYGYTS